MIASDASTTGLVNFRKLVSDELGYQPNRSLIAYGITADGPNRAFRIPCYSEPVALEHLQYLSAQLHAHGCTTAILIAFSDDPAAAHSLDRARFECEAADIDVIALLTVPGELAEPTSAAAGARP